MSRYARQEAVEGWDQSRLGGATLAIAGSGPTAFFTGLMAAAMGFGRLVLLGEAAPDRSHIHLLDPSDQAPVRCWAKLFQAASPQTRLFPIVARPAEKLIRKLPGLDGLIVCGNDPQAHRLGWKIARETSIPVVAGGATGEMGIWGSARADALTARFAGHPESPLLGQIIAGLLVDEIRKILMLLPQEEGRSRRSELIYLPYFAKNSRVGVSPSRAQPHIALVGAGALGTWFALALGMCGLKCDMHIYDGDEIDETNLNRQVLFFDALGCPKAPVLAARLQQLFPHLGLKGYGMTVDSDHSPRLRPGSALVACPDNFIARSQLNAIACKGRHTLFNGGTEAMGGSCMAYVPGYTACLSCRMQIEHLAAQERDSHSCARAAASVVTSNAVVGALLAWSVQEMLQGRATQSVWQYDGRVRNQRLGVHSPRPACQCHLQR